jgi:hypothetical protein
MSATSVHVASDARLADAIKRDPTLSKVVWILDDEERRLWAAAINSDPHHPQRFWRQYVGGRDVTGEDIRERLFPVDWSFEIHLGNFEEHDQRLVALLDLCLDHLDSITSICSGARDWWEQAGLPNTLENRRRYAPLGAKSEARFWALKNARLVQVVSDLPYSHSFSIRGSTRELRLMLCNVGEPELFTEKQFFSDYDNPPYKDSEGHLYLKTPLVPIGPAGARVAESIVNRVGAITGIPWRQIAARLFP